MAFISSWRIKDRQTFFAPLLPPDAACFDIGANFGEYSAAFLSLGARCVLAVEPQPALAEFITNSFPDEIMEGKLVVRAHAVGASAGTAMLYPSSDAGMSMSTLSPLFVDIAKRGGHSWDESAAYPVPVVTLDSLIGEFGIPDYIKIDVEGYDLEALRGLTQPVELVSFEYNTQPGLIDISAECIENIGSWGSHEFNYQVEAPGRTALQFAVWVSAAVMRYTLMHDIARDVVFGDIFARRRR
jgi:FkbM family methyltransferase